MWQVKKLMNTNGLNIIAKQNNREIYLLSYDHAAGTGFVADFERQVRYPEDNIQTIRKKGFWIDIQCSQNVKNAILKKVNELNSIDGQRQ